MKVGSRYIITRGLYKGVVVEYDGPNPHHSLGDNLNPFVGTVINEILAIGVFKGSYITFGEPDDQPLIPDPVQLLVEFLS